MAFVTIEDTMGSVECVFFSEPWAASQRALSEEQPVLVRGKLEKAGGEGGAKILAESAELLSDVREHRTQAVFICLDTANLKDRKSVV